VVLIIEKVGRTSRLDTNKRNRAPAQSAGTQSYDHDIDLDGSILS
jgi:hypothetical protein